MWCRYRIVCLTLMFSVEPKERCRLTLTNGLWDAKWLGEYNTVEEAKAAANRRWLDGEEETI